MDQAPDASPAPPGWKRALGIVGLVAHLVVGYIYLTVGLVTPMPWYALFLLVWAALLVLGIVLLRRHPLWVLLVPVLAFGLLVGGVSLGGAFLGWTA
ncbi:hypothetical protein FOJ82_05035 [Tessaracoccus rhinocerotis]|uniref:DUF4175 domain-containing protein n=1 Tax=Tessaracoccus rhinocerotis TaxID=1689449 RepID=A0A553K691_9ACTN|nr:hypothetical protein [Tessaracoccus rhinocerotis]TRY20228.1 hypothetical protein FOJ82_05035 [Tessaracoccus rhinocerotis]